LIIGHTCVEAAPVLGSRQGFFCKKFDIKTLEFFPSKKRKISQVKKELIAIKVKKV
jgi:hypothetical protein